MSKETQNRIAQLKKNYKDSQAGQLLKKSIRSPQLQDWLITKQIILLHLSQHAIMEENLKFHIQSSARHVLSFTTLIYLYKLTTDEVIKNPMSYYDSFKRIFEKMKEDNCYGLMISWIESLTQTQQYVQTVELMLETFSLFLSKEFYFISEEEIVFVLYLFNIYPLKTQRQMKVCMELYFNLKNWKTSVLIQKLQTKQVWILKHICQTVLSKHKFAQGNMALLLTHQIIKTQEKNIEKFINLHIDYISNLSQEQLCYLFNQLIKAAITSQIIVFLLIMTNVLANNEQFYKLKKLIQLQVLFQNVILPKVIRRSKVCLRDNLPLNLIELAEIVVIGFIGYCDYGQIGLKYLLTDISSIEDDHVKLRWIKLCFLVGDKKQSYKKLIIKQLKKQGLSEKLLQHADHTKSYENRIIWDVTIRNSRKAKVYKQQQSQLKGIINPSIQCYIISIVQALYLTGSFPKLIKGISFDYSKSKAVYQLSEIFLKFQSKYQKRITVDSLKRRGPPAFAQSQTQQDAFQYLISLFDQIQKELKHQKQGIYDRFVQIFQNQTKNTITCIKCNHKIQKTQSSYVHTIPNKSILSSEVKEILTDFQCPKCKQRNCESIRHLDPKSQIFILHLNRFSHGGGIVKKELSTQTISRHFKNYELIGMIFHIGKNVEAGHYVYYAKRGEKRWAELNDTITYEFELDKEDEQFELEMKAEKTPYILFYKLKE